MEAKRDENRATDSAQQLSEEKQIDAQIKAMMEGGETAPDGKKKRGPKKKRRLRAAVCAAIAIGALLLILNFAGGSKKHLQQVAAAPLTRGDITELLTVTGPIEGTDSVDVTSNLHAKITELHVKEGDRVEAGRTLLARLDTAELEKEIEAAEGSYALAVAQRDEKLRADTEAYQKAQQELNAAQAEYDRQAALYQSGDVAQTELEKAQNSLSDAKRTAASFSVKGGKVQPEPSMDIQISNARLALEQVKDKLADAEILAPISGTVTRVNTKVGQFADDIEDNKPMITIENLENLQMEIKVSEYSIGKVRPGQRVKISADILGDGKSVEGEVLSISPTGEEKGGGSTERVIPTKIGIADSDTGLIAGITARAQIVLAEAKQVFAVPAAAVGDDGTGQAVMQFIEPGGKNGGSIVRIVPVKIGIEGDVNLEVSPAEAGGNESLFAEGSLYLPTYDPTLADGTEVAAATQGAAS